MAAPPATRSTLRLSEVARHVVMPEGIKTTGWWQIRDTCADFGIDFDGWQDGLGQLVFGRRADGKYAATVGGVVLSIPRQVGKTFFVGATMVAFSMLFPGSRILWTAHRTRTATNTFQSLQGMVRRNRVWPHVRAVRTANGEQEIRFKNGSVIMFGAREQGFGRGFDEVDVEVFDEAQILTIKALEDMVAATNQAKHEHGALLFFMGTPPRPTDPGEMFTAKRAKAVSGESTDMVYVECSADEDANPDDPASWESANPSYPDRTPHEAMQRMRENLPDEASWRREALGIWDKSFTEDALVSFDSWQARAVAEPPAEGIKSFGIKFSPDGASVAVAGAMLEADKNVHIELVGAYSGSMANGTRQLIQWLSERWRDCASIVVDGPSHSGAFINALHDAGVNKRVLIVPTWPQVAAGNAMFLDAVVTGAMTHLAHEGQELLDESVLGATKKMHGDKGAWSWIGVDDDSDPLPVGAASLALYGARTSKRRPKGSAVKPKVVVM